MILGLTGGIGSGKSTVALELKKYGFKHVDADAECRKLTSKGSETLDEIVKAFGSEILAKNGVLVRKRLAKIVFSDGKKLKKLNTIMHKRALESCMAKLKVYEAAGFNVIFDIPLMFEGGWDKYCDKVLTISAKDKIRIERTVLRDNCTEDDVRARMAKQFTDSQREEKADYIIRNDKDLAALERSVAKFVKQLNI